MALTYDEYIAAYCPQLDASPLKDVYVEDALGMTSKAFFGSYWDKAVALRAAHIFTGAMQAIQDPSATGLVTGKSEGRTSISYWNSISKGSNSTLSTSKYGKDLKELITICGGGISIGNPEVL